jgi:hypothetical protein
MAIPKTRYLTAVFLLAGSTQLSFACRRDNEAGRAARAIVACAKACDRGLQVTSEKADPNCKNHCLARVVGSNRRCESLVLGWLDCMAAITPRVDGRSRGEGTPSREAPSRIVGTAALEGTQASMEARCTLERQLVERCEDACRLEGIRTSGETVVTTGTSPSSVKYELYECGCATCVAESGSAALAPCQSAKLCAERVFVCDGGVTKKRLRACSEARCAEAETAKIVLRQLFPAQRCTLETPRTP